MTTDRNNPICCPDAQGAKASTSIYNYVAVPGILKPNVLLTVPVLALAPWTAWQQIETILFVFQIPKEPR
jgi:hypothetical protein